MDIQQIIIELRREKEQLEDVIMAMERLAATTGKRRGRPPAWLLEAQGKAAKDGKKPAGDKQRP